MRVRLLSDLHREFGATEIPPVACDLILLAGDISTKLNALPWIREMSGETPVAYICGNHEFYGDRVPRVREKLQEATAGSHIHVLEDSSLCVNGWHVYGCTLWTDFALFEEDWTNAALLAGERMNDYKRIRNSERGYRKLTTQHTRDFHRASLQKMEAFLCCHDPHRTIIMTHHAPSLNSVPPGRRGEEITAAYASRLDDFILKHQPALWVHGHIHHPVDYTLGQTRIVSNPQGYPGGEDRGFKPSLTLELTDY